VHRCVIRNGFLELYNYRIQRTMYNINNLALKNLEFFLDHEFLFSWMLVDSPEPVDITDRYYRFTFQLNPEQSPKGKFVFNVREKTTDVEKYNVAEIRDDQLQKWNEKKFIDGGTAAAIEEIINLNKRKSEIGRLIYEKESEQRESDEAQERLRKNITVLKDHTQQERYIKQLGREEDFHKEIEVKVKQLRVEKKTVENEIQNRADTILFEGYVQEKQGSVSDGDRMDNLTADLKRIAIELAKKTG